MVAGLSARRTQQQREPYQPQIHHSCPNCEDGVFYEPIDGKIPLRAPKTPVDYEYFADMVGGMNHIYHVANTTESMLSNGKTSLQKCHAFCLERCHDTSTYCKFLPVSVNGVATTALVDSGNLWRNVISEEFFKALGLTRKDLVRLRQTTVGTAKSGANLEVLGETRSSLRMRLAGLDTKFSFKPVVLRGLSMPINIGGPFLKRHGIDQIHSKNCLRVHGQNIPLLASTTIKPRPPEAEFSLTFVDGDHVIPPMTQCHIPLDVPYVQKKLMPPGDGILEGGDALGTQLNLLGWNAALVTTTPEGKTKGGVMNLSSEPITITDGTKYGNFTRTCSPEEKEEMPWRICTLKNRSPTLQKKLNEAIGKAKEDDKKEEGEEEDDPMEWTEEKKTAWVKEQFRLEAAPALKTEEDRNEVARLLVKYFDVISVRGEYGLTKLMQHEIHTEDVTPIRCRHRPINPALEPDLQKQLQKWQKHDVIEESKSPWSFPLVAAPKKNGKIRWCVDYRKLNDVTKKDTFPLPHIEDNLARLAHSTVFSCIDGSGAFHVLEIRKEDRPKTAFSTPWGTYQYKRMPFGLTNGPASYSRLVQLVLHGIPQTVALPYLDDTIIHSRTVEGHLQNLELVLEAHRRAGLRLQPEKCQLFCREVDYLGHQVSADGISPQKEYVKVVQDWPMPTTKSEARVFLGKVGYYRRFIQGYSAIARPWTDVTGKGEPEEEKAPLAITGEMRAAFQELKQHLLRAPILAYPRFDSPEPFILDTDWSQAANAIGGVLSQVQDGKERVIIYGAKKMAKSQESYAPVKGELAAVLHFVKQWKYYLQYRPFILRVDHLPLKFIKTMEPQDNHTARMMDFLASYKCEVRHRPGTSHGNADALSRAPHVQAAEPADFPVGADDDDDRQHGHNDIAVLCHAHCDNPRDEQGQEEGEADSLPSDLAAMVMRDDDGKPYFARPAWLAQQQEEDEDLQAVRQWKREGRPPSIPEARRVSENALIYAQLFDQLELGGDDVLRFLKPAWDGVSFTRRLLAVPSALIRQVIVWTHESGGHQGIERTVRSLQGRFYFPHMRKEVALTLQQCIPCQKKTQRLAPQRGTLVSSPDGYPFRRLAIDFVGPIGPLKGGYNHLLTVRDTFTRWLEAFPIRFANAPTVARVMEREIFCRFGFPDSIHSDQGSQFKSKFFQDLTRELGIAATTTPAYNPKSNPVERAHRDLGNALRAIRQEKKCGWLEALPGALFALNTAVCSSTGFAPYMLLFGRDPSTPLDLIFGSPPEPDEKKTATTEYVRKLKERIQSAHRYARENAFGAIVRARRAYNLQKKLFTPGQLVWLFSPSVKPGVRRKFADHWTGPWTVAGAASSTLYRIVPHPEWKPLPPSIVVTVDRLKAYHSPCDPVQIPPTRENALVLEGDDFAEGPFPAGTGRRFGDGDEDEDFDLPFDIGYGTGGGGGGDDGDDEDGGGGGGLLPEDAQQEAPDGDDQPEEQGDQPAGEQESPQASSHSSTETADSADDEALPPLQQRQPLLLPRQQPLQQRHAAPDRRPFIDSPHPRMLLDFETPPPHVRGDREPPRTPQRHRDPEDGAETPGEVEEGAARHIPRGAGAGVRRGRAGARAGVRTATRGTGGRPGRGRGTFPTDPREEFRRRLDMGEEEEEEEERSQQLRRSERIKKQSTKYPAAEYELRGTGARRKRGPRWR